MIKRSICLIATAFMFGLIFGPAGLAQAEGPAATSSPAGNESVRSITVLTIHGKIAEVDRAKKLVTLEGPKGGRITVTVENPYNLKAATVGEPVVARYYEIVTIRKKKPGEKVPSASLERGVATAKPGGVPGAVAELEGSLVVTVEAIDKAKGTVTVKAPDGTVEKVKARDPRNLNQLKVGDELVISLARAIAISLEKAPAS